MTKQLQLKITDAAKQRIEIFLDGTGLDQPTPGLLLSMKTNEQPERWNIGSYSKEQIQDLEDKYASKGFVLIHEVDGIKLCVPQTQLVEKLDGKTLDYQEGRYVVV